MFAGREGTASRVARQPRTYVEVGEVATLMLTREPGLKKDCSRRGWMDWRWKG